VIAADVLEGALLKERSMLAGHDLARVAETSSVLVSRNPMDFLVSSRGVNEWLRV